MITIELTPEEEAAILANFSLPEMFAHLAKAAGIKTRMLEQPEALPDVRASLMLGRLLFMVGDLVGEEALRLAYGPDPEPGNEAERLTALARRVMLASSVFDRFERGAGEGPPASVMGAAWELDAIAKGDHSLMFKPPPRPSGTLRNSYRLAPHKLNALLWDAHLQSRGWRAEDSHERVRKAFGSSWQAIAKWREPVVAMLGALAGELIEDAREGRSRFRDTPEEEILSLIERDGAAYLKEYRRRLELVP